MADDRPSSRPPVGRVARTLIATLLFVGVTVPSFIIRELIEARMGRGVLADLAWIIGPMAATAWLAPRASYRRRDALLWPIGLGALIFVVIAWRVAFLPYRDWAPRPDETSRVRWLHGGQLDGLWHLAGGAK